MRKWKCAACGYVFSADEQPENCPACGAGADMIAGEDDNEELKAEGKKGKQRQEAAADPGKDPAAQRKWRCTVCNYVHTGEEPPDVCPVCGADKSAFVEITEKETAGDNPPVTDKNAVNPEAPEEEKPFGIIGAIVTRHHFHPITVHIPNGVLPVALVFLLLAVFFQQRAMELAAFFNLIFVLISLPVVYTTGFIAWKRKYRGARTFIFKAKWACSAIIAVLMIILVFWRILDPQVVFSGGTAGWTYISLCAVVLAVAGFAGSLGGRLVFGKNVD